MSRGKVILFAGFLFLALTFFVAGCGKNNELNEPLKIGVLPVEDTLPFYVAQEKGYFTDENVKVELVPFQSAVERDSAFQAGQTDGQITDLVAAALLRNAGVEHQVVMTTLGIKPGEGRFAVLAAPNSGIAVVEQLKGTEIAVSQNSVIEYVTDQLLLGQGFKPDEIKKITVPKIPVRLEMLLKNQIKAATLPDPLATYAQTQGAKVILDNSTENVSQVVLIFRKDKLTVKKEEVSGILKAYARAVKDIDANPESFRALFVEKAGVPEQIKDTYRVAHFSAPEVPTREQFDRVIDWMMGKELLKEELRYEDMVNGGFLGR
jgi:NitT/TauT family transport system substrate-binding protein